MLILKTAICRTIGVREKDNRIKKWNTKFRGKFLMHASKNLDKERGRFIEY
jgi:hypothetical protein